MKPPSGRKLDLITIGRSSVDLYGDQVGGRLEDMGSFSKYIGGSPTNIASGAARLGLRSALITRVGDEPMGRFIQEQLKREGVETEGVKTDSERLTALVLLGIRDRNRFPLIFYRENCADMALDESDIDEDFISSSRCVCATGTHLSNPKTEAAVLKALNLARKHQASTALDIDYRPNLWGLAGHDAGESRFIESGKVTEKLQSTLGLFDLIVGTEEEFHIAGGSTDTLSALRKVREKTNAVLVCKRGPLGASAFDAEIPDSLDEGLSGTGFEIEVFNVLGAGDGFMAGLLRGWLGGEEWTTALAYANACGALAVSRHGCAPAYPSWSELQFFLERGIADPVLRNDAELEHVHWATNRVGEWPEVKIFAFDHRDSLEAIADASVAGDAPAPETLASSSTPRAESARGEARGDQTTRGGDANVGGDADSVRRNAADGVGAFKRLCLSAALEVCGGREGYGILCDERFGSDALRAAADEELWIGRPAELPGSRPLALEPQLGPDCGGLGEWPKNHVVKLLCLSHPDDEEEIRIRQDETLIRLFGAARRNRLETLLELIPSRVAPCEDDSVARLIRHYGSLGLRPDWWKLEPMQSESAWRQTCEAVEENDPHVRGILILGLDRPEEELEESFRLAARFDPVKGFAVGRTIFSQAARRWFAGEIDDAEAIEDMANRYGRLCDSWERARRDAQSRNAQSRDAQSQDSWSPRSRDSLSPQSEGSQDRDSRSQDSRSPRSRDSLSRGSRSGGHHIADAKRQGAREEKA